MKEDNICLNPMSITNSSIFKLIVLSMIIDRAQADLEKMIPKLKDTHSWYEAWLNFAREREDSKDYHLASVYYQAAEFYLATTDPNKEKMYRKYRDTFYKGFHDFDYESYKIPYEDSYLPAVKLLAPGATKTLLVFGGYDSYMEEMLKMMKFMRIRSFSSPSAPLKYPIGQPTSLGYNQVSENPDLKSTKKTLENPSARCYS